MRLFNNKLVTDLQTVRARNKSGAGFTLIEILIVIILIGILAVAILAAINPVELLRKGRDTQRQADARELLGAYERFYTTYGCYPWNGTDCSTSTVLPTAQIQGFGAAETLLVTSGELKAQFENRSTIEDGDLWVTEDATTSVVSVCFEPESTAGRSGDVGVLSNVTNGNQGSQTCAGAYGTGSCYICLPQ